MILEYGCDTSAARYACVLEPLAVLGLLLGGQKVSLGFFTIIIFGERW